MMMMMMMICVLTDVVVSEVASFSFHPRLIWLPSCVVYFSRANRSSHITAVHEFGLCHMTIQWPSVSPTWRCCSGALWDFRVPAGMCSCHNTESRKHVMTDWHCFLWHVCLWSVCRFWFFKLAALVAVSVGAFYIPDEPFNYGKNLIYRMSQLACWHQRCTLW